MFQNISLLIACSLIFFSCKKDKPGAGDPVLPKDSTSKVLIVCEGSLGNGNAELSVYSPATDSVFNDVFKKANGQALGDVFQSIYKGNNQYFLCINNSDKITVIDSKSWKQQAVIPVAKPRYVLGIGDHKAYVGSLFSNKIYVVNTHTFLVEKQIEMPYRNIEGMLLKDGMAYICCWDTACNKLYRINTVTDAIADSVTLGGYAPQSILIDKEGHIWVLGGNAYKNKNTSLGRVDAGTNKLLQSFSFAPGIEAIKPCFNPARDTLYFLEVNYSGGTQNNGVYRMPIGSTALPAAAFISCQANQYFWALAAGPVSGKIYVGDPKGFVQKSTVMIYNSQGLLQRQFNVGLGVGAFYFD